MIAPNIGKHKSKFSIEHARCSMENENGFNHGHSRWGAAYYSVTSAFRLARSVEVTRIGSDGGMHQKRKSGHLPGCSVTRQSYLTKLEFSLDRRLTRASLRLLLLG
jgi:hypothetical protein